MPMIVECHYCHYRCDYWTGELRKIEGRFFCCHDYNLMECNARRRERIAAAKAALKAAS